MCERCRQEAQRTWGQPFPDPRELLEAIKVRAEVALDCGMLEAEDSHMTQAGAELVRLAIHETLVAMGEEMTERGLSWVPAWIAYLGQTAAMSAQAEERNRG